MSSKHYGSKEENEGDDEQDYDDIVKFSVTSLIPLGFIGLVDAIAFMIVAPSLVFYVIDEMGGTKEQYGIILSTFSFASFAFKPLLGYWSDQSGGTFRAPYFVSITSAAVGGLTYFLAGVFAKKSDDSKSSTVGLALIFAGRFLGGMGAANSTLGFTYIAQVVPHKQMTKASSMLTTVRIVGMAVAPALSFILDKVDGTITLGKTSMVLTPLNSVGLVLFIGNILTLMVVYGTLHEPPESTKPNQLSSSNDIGEGRRKFWNSVLSLDIMIPIFIIFSLNANFQLLETALAPASYHAMGWGPIQVSSVLSMNAIVMFGVIMLTYQLSAHGVPDISLLTYGQILSVVSYSLLYLFWKVETAKWEFLLPIVLSTACFPLLGTPSRSIFTILVYAKPQLRNHQGTMQALMSMSASVAGFVAPGFIAAFVLRSPSAVDSSVDQRELTKWALLAPFCSFVGFLGVLYLRKHEEKLAEAALQASEAKSQSEIATLIKDIDEEIDGAMLKRLPLSCAERRTLREVGDIIVPKKFHPRTEAHRHMSCTLMGVNQISFHENSSALRKKDSRKSARF